MLKKYFKNVKINTKKGFTLIELLVVIAIIGILSSVVLASLNAARGKGADAAVKSNLSNIRAQAEIQYDSLGCYTDSGSCNATTPTAVAVGACPTSGTGNIFRNANIASQIAAATSAGGSFNTCSATVGGTAWAVAVITKTAVADQPGSGWCVDSSGKSKSITVAGSLTQTNLNSEISAGACAE